MFVGLTVCCLSVSLVNLKASARTWLHLQRVRVDVDVQVPGGGRADLLQDTVHGLGDVVRHRLGELGLAVDDHAALPEVEDFQVLEAGQVGLEERQQLQTERGRTLRISLFTSPCR